MKNKSFKKRIMDYYEKQGRHYLTWRKDITPYKVLVSEVMLQQTQVERVIPFFERWIKKFPSFEDLAKAKRVDILCLWSGLGYNSRVLRLQKTAQIIMKEFSGNFPVNENEIKKLPGIGPYTLGAMKNIAFKEWHPFMDTNIRRVFIHHFFQKRTVVSDEEIFLKIKEIGFEKSPRDWAYALMDYGSFLKKTLKENPNKKAKAYRKQTKFIGSERQVRGAILRILLKGNKRKKKTFTQKEIFAQLEKDGVWSLFWEAKASPKKRPSQNQEKVLEIILKKMEKENLLSKKNKSITLR